MQFLNFNKEAGKRVTAFDSVFVMNHILRTSSSVQIGCMHLERSGIIGYHQATVPQLLLILKGKGKVRGREDKYVKVQEGDAIYWEKGEWHETVQKMDLSELLLKGKI